MHTSSLPQQVNCQPVEMTVLSAMLALEPSCPSLSLLLGTSTVQMSVPHSQFTLIAYIPEEKEYLQKTGVKHKSLLSSSCCLWCLYSKPDMLSRRIGYWHGLPLSFCLPFVFFPSPSLNWGQGPLGFALLCYRKIANLGYTLNSESRSFIKKLICYSLLRIHSISFSQTLPFFCWTGSHCHTPASFLRLFSSSLYTAFILSFPAVTPPPLLGTPMVWLGYNGIMWLS